MAHEVNQSEMDVAAQVRSALVDRISSERLDLWIPDTTSWQWDAGRLTLTFPNQFSCQLAKKMLQGELASVAKELTSTAAQVEFVVDESGGLRRAIADAQSDSSSTGSIRDAVAAEKRRRLESNVATAPIPSLESTRSVDASAFGTDAANAQQAWDSFVRGSCNEMAWTAANLAISDPGRLTPVLFHGPSGAGKTALVGAIAKQLRGQKRLRRVVQMTSEQFTNDFMEALRGGGLPIFRRKYRDVEALLLDDVQFFAGKKATIAEVNHTVDILLRNGKQVVFTSDRSVNELQHLGTGLVNQLRGGLVAPLFPLDQETRFEVLTQMLQSASIDIDEPVRLELSDKLAGDGRVLRGVAHRLTAMALTHSKKLDWEGCWNAVYDLVQAAQPVVRLGDIERVVCNVFGLDTNSLQSSSKMRTVSQPRMLAMFLARKYTPAAYKEIGDYFGRRHSTVISAEKTVNNWLSDGAEVSRGMTARDAIRHVESQLHVG